MIDARRTVSISTRLVTSAAVLVVLSCARTPVPPPLPLPPAPLDLPDETWVHNTLTDMSLEERVGQMLMLRLNGGFENYRGAGMREAERYVDDLRIGGFVVGIGSPLDVAMKLNELQSRARLPLVFGADLEWGAGMRLWKPTYLPYGIEAGGGTAFPFNMGVAATGDLESAELIGRITAREARAVGIQWVFAPVVDINTAADNPIVNVRSYSSDPGTVGDYAAAFIRGATAGGVLTTAKHFPGHGDTHVDSHVELPVVDVLRSTLEHRELRPFRKAIAAGVSSVMLGHIAVPSLTDSVITPATLAPQMGRDLLRGDLGFNGLVITDAMTMGALKDTPGYSPGEIAIRAVEAGADVVLSPPDPVLAHRALVEAVRSGRIHYTRVDSSVARILRAKARLGLHRVRTVSLDSVPRIIGAPEHEAIAADIAARSITIANDVDGNLPLDPRRVRTIAVVAFSAAGDVRAGAVFADELRRIYGRGVSFVRLDENSSSALHDKAVDAAAAADAAIFATFLMPISGQGHLTVPEGARDVATRMHGASKKMMVVAFGDPYGPATLPGADTYVLAWQPRGNASQRAAARAIAGRTPITGRMPITLPRSPTSRPTTVEALDGRLAFAGPADVGMDVSLIQTVDSIIEAGIVKGASPGAAVAIGRHGKLVMLGAYGDLDRRRGFNAVTDSSLYDLASVTKVVATTTALMMMIDDGLISLDDPVGKYITEWRGPVKDRVTVRNLMLHNAGIAPYAPLWRELQGRDAYRRRIATMSLEYEPGTKTVYSDFGIILVGLIIERVSGRPLDVLLHERVFGPLGMRDTGFNPLQWPYGVLEFQGEDGGPGPMPDPLLARIAPTEIDTVFRKRHIRGQVHDENAYALGGVAGHAGLFSSARDLAVFAQMMLNGGFYAGRRYIDPETISQFTRRQGSHGSSRALGWDTPTSVNSAGSYFTASSFGHTGFTGPSIWIDPERDVFVVLLLNRVNPTRENQRHVSLRIDLADVVQRAIVDLPVVPRADRVTQ